MSLKTVTVLCYCYCLIHCVYLINDITMDCHSYDDYVLLASDVQEWNRASSVFIIFGGNDESFTATTLMLHLVRAFSDKNVVSLSANYTEILTTYRSYYKRIVKPLIVVLLSSVDDVISFRDTIQAYYDVSYPQWLIIFMTPRISEFCQRPINNIFHLKFNTNMLVKCYGDSKLREWYSVHDSETMTYDLAMWNPVMRFKLMTNKTFYERRNNIGGKSLRVATVMDSLLELSQNGVTQSSGFYEKIVEELSKAINFTYKVTHKESSYGIRDTASGTWSGVVGRILEGHADIGVAEMTMTVERMEALDFTVPLMLSKNRLYMQPPSGSVVQWSAYSRAFDCEIWVTLGIMLMLSVALITIIRMYVERKSPPPGLVSENCLTVWGVTCQQGLADFPTATSLRIAYFSLFMLSVVLLAIYSACLISYLTLTVPSLPFSDLEGFVENGYYQLIAYLGSADYDMFMLATDPTLMKMRENLKRHRVNLPSTVMGGFQMVCENSKVAFHVTQAVKDQLNVLLPCDLVSIDTGRFDSLGMVLAKGSPYTGVINYHLQKFKGCGIMSRLKRKYFVKVASPSNEYQPVTLRGIVPLIVVLLVGVTIAMFVLLSEKLVFRLNQKKADRSVASLNTLPDYNNYIDCQS